MTEPAPRQGLVPGEQAHDTGVTSSAVSSMEVNDSHVNVTGVHYASGSPDLVGIERHLKRFANKPRLEIAEFGLQFTDPAADPEFVGVAAEAAASLLREAALQLGFHALGFSYLREDRDSGPVGHLVFTDQHGVLPEGELLRQAVATTERTNGAFVGQTPPFPIPLSIVVRP